MNVASLELCKELYELSGWQYEMGTNGFWYTDHTPDLVVATYVSGDSTPAYDLGYLLRKLPESIGEFDNFIMIKPDNWRVGYGEDSADDCIWWKLIWESDTPEDAVAKLAIELFKQGVLKKEKK
jgi:hypothetical protein